jgi:ABC-2 type transport system permease protein
VKHFTGTGLLTLTALRRDRVQLAIWVVLLAGSMGAGAAAVKAVLETEEDLISFTELYVVNLTMRLFGLASGVSEGGFAMTRAGFVFLALAALMSFLIVTRHTRQDEDDRRTELIRSTVVGRHASLATGLIVAVSANIALVILGGLALMFNGLSAQGSFAASASIGAVGLAFTGIGAISAQLSGSGRGANGMSAMVLGVTFLLAGIGNMLGRADEAALRVESHWLVWFSPIGWSQQVRPFHDNAWWVLILPVALFAAAVLIAFKLESNRDLGRGMIPERRGPAEAAPTLLSPLGLAWRLQKGLLIGWAIGIGIYGIVLGAVSNEMESLLAEMEGVSEFIERLGGTERIVDAFFSTVMGLIGTIIAIFALQVLLRMRADEDGGLAEAVLATSVSRARWTASFIGVAVGGVLVLLLVAGLTAGISSGIVMNDVGGQMSSLLQTALVQAPATLVIAGVVVAAFGLLPRRAAALSWGVFAVALATGPVVGEILDLPQWLREISPFTHTPLAMVEDVSLAPVVAMGLIAAALAAVGVASFRRRDLAFQSG